MQFESNKKYRMRAVAGEAAIKANEKTGTRYVEVMCEVTAGPLETERVRYRGYLNTAENAERAANDLRRMGWRGLRWGDWSGIGSREFQGTTMIDVGDDGRKWARVAFVNDVPTISDKGTVDAGAVDELNKLFAPPPPPARAAAPTSANGAAPPPQSAAGDAGGAGDEIPF
jgi:hypothetical protein